MATRVNGTASLRFPMKKPSPFKWDIISYLVSYLNMVKVLPVRFIFWFYSTLLKKKCHTCGIDMINLIPYRIKGHKNKRNYKHPMHLVLLRLEYRLYYPAYMQQQLINPGAYLLFLPMN